MADDVPGASGFQIASAYVEVSPDADSFAEQLEGELGELKYVVQIPVVPDTEDFAAQVDAAVSESKAAVSVPVVPDTADFAAAVDAAVADTKAAVAVPVEPDAAGFAEAVQTEVADAKTEIIVPMTADGAGLAQEAEAEAGAAGEAAGLSFSEKYSNVASSTALFKPDTGEADASAGAAGETAGAAFSEQYSKATSGAAVFKPDAAEADAAAGAAGEAAGLSFSEKFSAAAQTSNLFPAAAAERDAEVAGEESATTFGSKLSSVLSGLPVFGGLFSGAEKEASEAGDLAGGSFMGSLKTTLLGDAGLLEVALGAGFVAATADMATKFQSAMEMIHTQAGVGQSAIAGLSSSVLALAGQVGESPDSLAQALYHIESSFQSVGISGSAAMNLLKTAAEGARTGGADLVDVTNALDATIASGIGGVHNYTQAMGALNAIVGAGDMTMQDLANAMGTGLMAVAKSYGQNIEDVGAALATFGDNNIRGAKAATDLRMAMQAILAPIKTGAGYLQNLGLTMTDLGNTMEHQGLTAAIQEFVEHLQASKIPVSDWGEYVTNIFGKKAGAGIGVLIDQLGRLQSKLPDIQRGADSFGADWQATAATTAQKLHDLESAFEALAIKIGTALLPYVNSFLGGLDKGLPVVERFGSELMHIVSPVVESFFTGLGAILKVLFGPMRDVTIAIGGMAAAWVALDAIMAINPFVAIAMALITLVGVIIKYHQQIMDAIHKYWTEIEIFLAGVVLAVPVLGLLIAVIKYHQQIYDAITSTWHSILAFFDSIKDAITSGFDSWWASHGQEIEDVWKAVWTTISDVFKIEWAAFTSIAIPAFNVFRDVFTAAFSVIGDAFKSAWDVMAAVFTVFWDGIEAAVKVAWDLIVGMFDVSLALITGHWSQAWQDAQNTLTQIWNAIEQYFQQVWNTIASLFTQQINIIEDALKTAWDAIQSVAEDVWNGIQQYFVTMWHTIEELFSSTISTIKNALLTGWNSMKSDAESVWNAVTSFFSTFWAGLKLAFSTAVTTIQSSLVSGWNTMKSDAESVWNSISSFFKGIWSDMETGFQNAVTAIGKAWSSLQTIFSAPVKFLVNTVYDQGIAALWNDVAGAIPGIPKLPIVSFARGGRVTAGSGPKSDDVLARVSRGETVVSAEHSKTLAPIFGAIGVPGYAAGGIPGGGVLGDIGHAVGSAASTVGGAIATGIDAVASVAKIVAALATGNTTALANALNALIKTPATGELAAMMIGIPKTIIKDAIAGIGSAISSFVASSSAAKAGPGGGGKGGITSAGVTNSSAEAALQAAAAKMGWTGAQWQALYDVEMREAGFSLTAQNPKSGAYGMAQFINGPSEYAQYGGNSTTAAGQATAMINYIAQRYGSPEAAWAHEESYGWYANGGVLGPGEVGIVGEAGPEMIQGGRTGATVTPMGAGRGATVNVNFYGTQYPTPEQLQAFQLEFAQAVAMS